MRKLHWVRVEETPRTENFLEVYSGELGASGYHTIYIYADLANNNLFYKQFKLDPSDKSVWFIGVLQ
jgi:hypothetical protein